MRNQPAFTRAGFVSIVALALCFSIASCSGGGSDDDPTVDPIYVVGHESAKESVLRAIPSTYIKKARTSLHVAYQHTSHGTHVSYGLYGLQDYKTGDSTLFGVSTSSAAGKLDFQDHDGNSGQYLGGGIPDLSNADSDWPGWVAAMRVYLDDSANAKINVMMWSWCDISGHHVSDGYLPSMQKLIGEYGSGGSKIGSGAGKTRTTPVTFVFMTGHAYTTNVGYRLPKNQADLITAYCKKHGYYCLDYYSIDSHDMEGNYYADATDDASSANYGGNYNQDWQDAHTEGTDWFVNKSAPGGSEDFGNHESQYITANRKAYAMWYILARIAGWEGG